MNPDQSFHFSNNKSETLNKELLENIKKEYPTFQSFWDAVLEQVREGKGQVYYGDQPTPLYTVRLFASKISSIKTESQSYKEDFKNDPGAMMPVKSHNDFMDILQKTLGIAADTYYGARKALDKDGKLSFF